MDRRVSPSAVGAPLHVEFALAHVIAHARIQNVSAVRRLNGIENTLAALAVEWREWSPIDPLRELRMAESTLTSLTMWVRDGGADQHSVARRLADYSSSRIVDQAVPPGWVRLLLAGGPV